MKLQGFDITCDVQATRKYRDRYNQQCECDQCKHFRLNFHKHYPESVKLLNQFGIDILYPLEIMDLGFQNGKREYSVFYSVKGELPEDKIELKNCELTFIFRNWKIASESYANTGMQKPYFIIEVSNIFLSDLQVQSD